MAGDYFNTTVYIGTFIHYICTNASDNNQLKRKTGIVYAFGFVQIQKSRPS